MSDVIPMYALFVIAGEIGVIYFALKHVTRLCDNFLKHIEIVERQENNMKIFEIRGRE